MTTALTIPAAMQSLATIRRDTIAAVVVAQASGDTIIRDMTIAYGLQAMRKAMTPEAVAMIAGLGGTSLGWRHDMERRGGSYPPDVIRDCAIEALLRGLSLTGNQFNIISSRCYVTREGYSALLSHYPGLTDLEVEVGIPEDGRPCGKPGGSEEMVMVAAAARCKVNGKPVSVECRKSSGFDGRLAVKTFAGEVDNPKGKAQRRLLKLLYERITGSMIDEPEDGVEQSGTVTVVEPVAAVAVAEVEQPDDWKKPWMAERKHLPAGTARDLFDAIMRSTDCPTIDKLMAEVKASVESTKHREVIERAATFMVQRVLSQIIEY